MISCAPLIREPGPFVLGRHLMPASANALPIDLSVPTLEKWLSQQSNIGTRIRFARPTLRGPSSSAQLDRRFLVSLPRPVRLFHRFHGKRISLPSGFMAKYRTQ